MSEVKRYTGWDYVDGTSDRCEVVADYKSGDETRGGTVYVLASAYDALAAQNAELVEALREAQASYLRLAQSVRNCGHEHLLSDEDDATLSRTQEPA